MYRTRLFIAASILSLSLVLLPHFAHAEFFIDAYIGRAFSRDSEASLSLDDALRTALIDTDDTLVVGGRLGYWFGFFPWLGLALDASYFELEGESFEVMDDTLSPILDTLDTANFKILPVSALLMVRIPNLFNPVSLLTGLKPYGAIGPTLMLTQVDLEGFDASGAALGYDVRAGLRWDFLPVIGFFAEYRYVRVEDDFQDALRGFPASLDVTFTTHYVTGGVSLRF